MKTKILAIIVVALMSITLPNVFTSCQKDFPVHGGLGFLIVDKAGNNLLVEDSEYYIGDKIKVLLGDVEYSDIYRFNHFPTTNLPPVHISDDPINKYDFAHLRIVFGLDYFGPFPDAKITLPNGTTHSIHYLGHDEKTRNYWEFDGVRIEEANMQPYIIVYNPEEQK